MTEPTDQPCTSCGEYVNRRTCADHAGLCCDCCDLSWGMSLEIINKERAERGAAPLSPKKKP